MRSAWRFLSSPDNQRTLTFVGTGLAALVVAGWSLFLYLDAGRDDASNETRLTVAEYSTLVVTLRADLTRRHEAELARVRNDSVREQELRALQERELALSRAREADQARTIAELNRLLTEVRTAISAPTEALPPNEIEVANTQIGKGDFKAAETTLTTYAKTLLIDAGQAEFLLAELAQNEADLEKAARHYRKARLLDPANTRYRERENAIYQFEIIYDTGMSEAAKTIAQVFADAGIPVGRESWLDFREDGDGAMSGWFSGPALVYAESTGRYKAEEYEDLIRETGALSRDIGHAQGVLRRRGTEWTFPPLRILLWIPNEP